MPVASNTNVVLSAAFAGATRTTNVKLLAPVIKAIAASPSPVRGGGTVTLTIALSGAAPDEGVSVALASSAPGTLAVPASIAISAGKIEAAVAVTAATVTAAKVVTVSATFGGKKSVSIRVQP